MSEAPAPHAAPARPDPSGSASREPRQATAVVVSVREARRLKERFLTRATAVFYARVALLLLGLCVLIAPSWTRAFQVHGVVPWAVFVLGIGWAVLCQAFASHPVQGRRVMFVTLVLDLAVLIALIARSGGLLSPAMPVQLLFTIFFALLFPNPIAIVPPLVVLPAVILVSLAGDGDLPAAIMRLAWLAALNGIAVYVIVYLTSREEKATREILELETSLKKMAIVEERNRIARDIHDGLGASLSGVIIQAEYLMTLTRKDDDLQAEVRELKSGAEEAIDEVRRAVSVWRDDFVLVPQLENMCSTFTQRHHLPVDLHVEGDASRLTEQQELGLFRILQECLTNIAKHARATRVTVTVRFAPERIEMKIVDDGAGFDPQRTPRNHYGLINMRERAKKANGTVVITSSPGHGTNVTLVVRPLPGASARPRPQTDPAGPAAPTQG